MENTLNTKNTPNAKYEAPLVTDYGNLAEITAGSVSNGPLDATFPAGTPQSDLTFS